MKIGELANAGGVTTQTVRYYESLGLLEEPERTATGYRNYGVESPERLRFIRDAQASGLTLDEIASVLELKEGGERSCAHTTALLEAHLEEIDAQVTRLRKARSTIAGLIDRAREIDPATCTDPNRCQVIAG